MPDPTPLAYEVESLYIKSQKLSLCNKTNDTRVLSLVIFLNNCTFLPQQIDGTAFLRQIGIGIQGIVL